MSKTFPEKFPAKRLLTWFDATRRDLPWRREKGEFESRLDPYAVLVSELMLQQTQVATVIPYFRRWMMDLPTVVALANAPEGQVLKLWEGLGYYSRARNLQAAARKILGELGGRFPETVEELRALPGVGPYTAGAIASIAFNRAENVVDGNVARVLARVYAWRGDVRGREGQVWLWKRAREILPGKRTGDFNSALMELGATVCTPRKPACEICPLRAVCEARRLGLQEEIPAPKKRVVTPTFERTIHILQRADGAALVEQRPAKGRWAGLWQFPTRESGVFAENAGADTGAGVTALGTIHHALTHRRYVFAVLHQAVPAEFELETDAKGVWMSAGELARLAMPRPQRKAEAMWLAHLQAGVRSRKSGFAGPADGKGTADK